MYGSSDFQALIFITIYVIGNVHFDKKKVLLLDQILALYVDFRFMDPCLIIHQKSVSPGIFTAS